MSTPTDADRVTLHIAGHVHGDWLKYSIDSDFFTPADGWSVSLGTPATALPEYLQPWAEVQIRVGDELVMSGCGTLSAKASMCWTFGDVTGPPYCLTARPPFSSAVKSPCRKPSPPWPDPLASPSSTSPGVTRLSSK